MAKTRKVEMAIAQSWGEGDHGEWYTDYYDIPVDTPEEKIEEVAVDVVLKDYEGDESFQHTWLYSLPVIEDDDEEDSENASD